MSRHFSRRRSVRRPYTVENLETRCLLSTINWTNRAAGDNFAALGAAATGRAIVDRAIDDWERVITNFNYSGGGNTFSVNISVADLGPGSRGSTGVSYNAQQRPISATITLDDDGGGSGWYLDSAVGTALVPDDSEFTTMNNAFQANGSSTDFDFYRTIAHELGHAMGLASSSTLLQGLDTNIGDDPNDGGTADLFTVNLDGNPGADYTYTNAGGFHLYEGPAVGGNPIHPNELMNSGRTAVTGRRQLISDTIATLLRDAYGYTVTLPSAINTFYANLNITTNTVTVTGDIGGDTTDVIDVELTGTNSGDLRVEANGTSEVFPDTEYTTIVVNALTDIDDVDVDELESGKTVTVNLGDGNDRCDITQELGDIDTNLNSNVTVNGGIGTDILDFHDTADLGGGDDWTFTTSSVTKNAAFINRVISYGTMEQLIANGADNANTFDINSLSSTLATGLTINAGAAGDTITLGGTSGDIDTLVNADVVMNGGGGTDALIINDAADDASVNDSYTLTSTTFAKSSTTESYTFATVENVTLDAGLANNAINVSNFTGGGLLGLTINGGDGDDDVTLGSGDLDSNLAFVPITVNGNAGADSLALNDLSDAAADDYTFTTTTFDKSTPGIDLVTFGTTETVTLEANPDANTVNIQGVLSSVSLTADGNGGADTFNLGVAGGNAEQLNGSLTINGNAGTDAWNYLDSTNIFNNTYTLTSTTVTRTSNGVVTFGTIEDASLDIGPGGAGGGQIVNVTTFSSVSTDLLSLLINGNTGIDTMNLGSGDLENDLAFVAITVNGGGGADTLYLNDLTDAETGDTYTFTATTFDKSTAGLNLITFGTTENVTLDANAFANPVNINAIASGVALTVRGNGGADTFNISTGDMDTQFLGGTLSVDGGADSDTIIFNDTADGIGADIYTINSTTLDKTNFAAPINYTSFETQRLDASPNADAITMNSAFAGWRINGNAGTDTIDVVGNQFGTSVTVDSGSNGDIVSVNADNGGAASITFPLTQLLSSLTIGNGGTAIVAAGATKVLYTNTLTIDAVGGKLDLNNNDAIINYAGATPAATIRSRLISGRAGGVWSGVGIASSVASAIALDAGNIHKTALGYAEATAIGSPPSFDGIAIDATTIVISYTWTGDTDLSQKVNTLDFNPLAGSFGTAGQIWVDGDYNYDSVVDSLDFNQLLTNYALPTAAPVVEAPVVASPPLSPEPGPADDATFGRQNGRDFFSDNPVEEIA